MISAKFGEWVEDEIRHPHESHGTKKRRTIGILSLAGVLLLVALMLALMFRGTGSGGFDPAAMATISVASDPPGAKVILAGDSIGVTAISDYHVRPGLQSLRLEKDDFFALDSSFIIESDRSVALFFAMVPAARVAMQVQPRDALVILDEKRLRQGSLSNLVLPAGEHQLSISAEGFQNLETSIRLEQGQNPPLSFSLSKIAIASASVQALTGLRIASTPADADVFIDELLVGKTPYQKLKLEPGSYRIAIRKEGYEDYASSVVVTENQVSDESVRLTELTGMLIVETQPGHADVYLDGRHIGSTPLDMKDAKIGDHSILIRKKGYEDYSTLVTIDTDQESRVAAQLKALMGMLRVRVKPYGSIYVDGRLHKENTNIQYSAELAAGGHQLTVEHPALGSWSKTVAIPANGVETLLVDFTQEIRLMITANDENGSELNAEIFVDDESTGEMTPREITLRVGLHMIEVRLDGYSLPEGGKKINLEDDLADPIEFKMDSNQ